MGGLDEATPEQRREWARKGGKAGWNKQRRKATAELAERVLNNWTPERRRAASERVKGSWTPERRAAYSERMKAQWTPERRAQAAEAQRRAMARYWNGVPDRKGVAA